MYYLKSRYYDPEVCRFINADSFASTGQGIIGYNMFAYCNNNPVNFSDTSGSKMNCCIMVDDGGRRDVTEQFFELMQTNASILRSYYDQRFEFFYSQYKSSLMINESAEPPINNSSLMAFSATLEFFRSKVTDYADWDIKHKEYSYRTTFIVNGKLYTGEQLGNIHYGYVGSAVFPPFILYLGAGINQAGKDFHAEYFSTWFDEPDDYAMVSYGIELYKEG